jgi:hypothetical protein
MNFHSSSRCPLAVALRLLLILFFAVSFCLVSPGPAFAASHEAILEPPLAVSWWNQFYGWVEHNLSSQTRMIQLATVGMIIGLLIMMKK